MPTDAAPAPALPRSGGRYANYVLFVLVIVYVFNFIDRNILSILSQDIQRDLGVGDAEMGFLYGTVFAVFYAVFGIPLARFADVWVRRSLISAGLLGWSLMTALSGFARSFPMLAACRIGVGIGEASASPAAYSLLSDYYAPRVRATVLAIYSSGVYIGGGIGLFLGGFIMETWNTAYPDRNAAPLQFAGWQAAFLAVGIPGILMAIWVRTLREPERGASEGLVGPAHPAPFSVLGTELKAMMPVFNLLPLHRAGGSVPRNLLAGLAIALVATGLALLSGDKAQWITLGIGAYIVVCWAQSLRARDNATFQMIFGSKAMVYAMIAFPLSSFVTYGTGYWTAPLMLRLHDTSAGQVGMYLGLGAAVGGLIGVTLGGVLADRLKLWHPAGRLLVPGAGIVLTAPAILWTIYTPSLETAFVLNLVATLTSAMGTGIPPTTAADLVMPRMRAIAGAYYILLNTMIGLALGPYAMGKLSDVLAATGMSAAESLRLSMTCSLAVFLVALVFLALAFRHLPKDEATRLQRAARYGEPIAA